MIEKFKKYYENIFISFTINMIFVWGCWKVLLKASQVVEPFKTHWDNMMNYLSDLIAYIGYLMLYPFYDKLIIEGPLLYLKGMSGVIVGPACVGIGVVFTYVGLILSYKGPVKLKVKFVFVGIAMILGLNSFRVAVLCIISAYHHSWTEFNHKYVFNNLLYLCILLMWARYVNKTSNKNSKENVAKA
jgi:exosortase/archaeosortase family protein